MVIKCGGSVLNFNSLKFTLKYTELVLFTSVLLGEQKKIFMY